MRGKLFCFAIFVSFSTAQQWCGWDGRFYHAIHDDMQCRLLDHATNSIGFISDIRTTCSVPVALYLLGKEKEHDAAKLIITSLALSLVTVVGLKTTINRQRPIGDSPRWDSSFPSGHTTLAFSSSIIYGKYYPKLMIPLLLYSTLVGFSRIYKGEHYPTDVLAGMALGTGISFVVLKFQKNILSLSSHRQKVQKSLPGTSFLKVGI